MAGADFDLNVPKAGSMKSAARELKELSIICKSLIRDQHVKPNVKELCDRVLNVCCESGKEKAFIQHARGPLPLLISARVLQDNTPVANEVFASSNPPSRTNSERMNDFLDSGYIWKRGDFGELQERYDKTTPKQSVLQQHIVAFGRCKPGSKHNLKLSHFKTCDIFETGIEVVNSTNLRRRDKNFPALAHDIGDPTYWISMAGQWANETLSFPLELDSHIDAILLRL